MLLAGTCAHASLDVCRTYIYAWEVSMPGDTYRRTYVNTPSSTHSEGTTGGAGLAIGVH